VQPLEVLVVDDDPAALRWIARVISSAGHRVLRAENGRQALDLLLENTPDLVVCDWDMPELDGLELCREIRRREFARYVYVLILTAKAGADDVVAGLAAGADDFVIKPVRRPVLLARLEAGSRLLRLERKLRVMSEHDPLTGLLNRRAFYQRFVREWERASRHLIPLACVMVDIDFFKRINDAHGHGAGDEVLRSVSAILRDQLRSNDTLCRYGGEEFCVLLTETGEEGAARWAERARVAIAEAPIFIEESRLRLTASFGVAERMADTKTPEQLAELADQALAVAKQSGRNRVVSFTALKEPMPDLADEQSFGPLAIVRARDVMSTPVFCPRDQDTVRQVADLFLQLRINSAPVVDADGNLAGIVSEADLLTATASGDGWDQPVGGVVRADVVCYTEDTPVVEVYRFLSRVSVRRIVVVDGRRPTGVISRGTLLRWFRNWAATGRTTEVEGQRWSEREGQRRRADVLRTAEAIVRRAAEISEGITGCDEDFVPCVVGEATRLQSLVNDLLGYCRSAPPV
jgi:diguanylate cyclase (GGDEF)-like protein